MFGFGFTYNTTNPLTDGGGFDPDAETFFTASGITDTTQKNAVNQLVLDLKSYNIWTKMTALYPIVGGSASSHAVNLKTPGTYNLTFSTGWTHASTGMTPNGTSAYANPALAGNENSNHFSIYSRTNIEQSSNDIGCRTGSSISSIAPRVATNTAYFQNYNTAFISFTNSDSRGFYCNTRTASNSYKAFVNGISKGTATDTGVANNYSFYLGARNNLNTAENFSTRQLAFASIGTGLTDTESANFYTAVQAYQTTLGRSIGSQTVSDSDAQAFITSASIEDQVEATALNNLVIGLKADSLWTKMKAIYPIVGGSASSHAVNLKTPGTYNLSFSTGWTHASTGMTPNGSSAYADTALAPNVMSLNSIHGSIYLRLNNNSNGPAFSSELASTFNNGFYLWPKQPTTNQYSVRINDNTSAAAVNGNIQGLNIITRTASNVKKYRIKTTEILNLTTPSTGAHTESIYLGKSRNNPNYYTNSYAFLSFGDGLTDTEADNLNTRVQNFQTELNRQV